eukprot:jgi/Ulvmu1/10965/UM007_0144.1
MYAVLAGQAAAAVLQGQLLAGVTLATSPTVRFTQPDSGREEAAVPPQSDISTPANAAPQEFGSDRPSVRLSTQLLAAPQASSMAHHPSPYQRLQDSSCSGAMVPPNNGQEGSCSSLELLDANQASGSAATRPHIVSATQNSPGRVTSTLGITGGSMATTGQSQHQGGRGSTALRQASNDHATTLTQQAGQSSEAVASADEDRTEEQCSTAHGTEQSSQAGLEHTTDRIRGQNIPSFHVATSSIEGTEPSPPPPAAPSATAGHAGQKDIADVTGLEQLEDSNAENARELQAPAERSTATWNSAMQPRPEASSEEDSLHGDAYIAETAHAHARPEGTRTAFMPQMGSSARVMQVRLDGPEGAVLRSDSLEHLLSPPDVHPPAVAATSDGTGADQTSDAVGDDAEHLAWSPEPAHIDNSDHTDNSVHQGGATDTAVREACVPQEFAADSPPPFKEPVQESTSLRHSPRRPDDRSTPHTAMSSAQQNEPVSGDYYNGWQGRTAHDAIHAHALPDFLSLPFPDMDAAEADDPQSGVTATSRWITGYADEDCSPSDCGSRAHSWPPSDSRAIADDAGAPPSPPATMPRMRARMQRTAAGARRRRAVGEGQDGDNGSPERSAAAALGVPGVAGTPAGVPPGAWEAATAADTLRAEVPGFPDVVEFGGGTLRGVAQGLMALPVESTAPAGGGAAMTLGMHVGDGHDTDSDADSDDSSNELPAPERAVQGVRTVSFHERTKPEPPKALPQRPRTTSGTSATSVATSVASRRNTIARATTRYLAQMVECAGTDLTSRHKYDAALRTAYLEANATNMGSQRVSVKDGMRSQLQRLVDGGDEYAMSARVELLNLGDVIDLMVLEPAQKRFLRTRYLKPRQNNLRTGRWLLFYYRVIGLLKTLTGVLVPVLISMTSVFTEQPQNRMLSWGAVVLSVIGTLTVALEDFFQYGARARARQLCVVKLDRIFWAFHALSGPWDGYEDHRGDAFRKFTVRIEEAVREAEVQHIATFTGETDAGNNTRQEMTKAKRHKEKARRAGVGGGGDVTTMPSALHGMASGLGDGVTGMQSLQNVDTLRNSLGQRRWDSMGR